MAGVDVGTAYLTVVPSAKGFAGKLQSELGGGMDKAGKDAGRKASSGFGSTFGSGIKTSAVAGAAALAGVVAGGIAFARDAISEARESQKVGALTTQVIKTTGGAAKVTAGQVGDLATAISNKTGIDDEAIQSASNLLLTFTNLRNETGKGNDVFNQATKIATDMGAALGTEPKAAAIQLGKALNDPVKGITALQRVGVSFTKQQKDQIGALVKSGDTLGAQKIILGELNKEFGGSAAASATMGEKMSVAFGNVKEQIGTALLPVLDKVEAFITTKVVPAVSKFIDEFQKGTGAGGKFRAILTTIVTKVKNFITEFQKGEGAGGKFRDILEKVAKVSQAVAKWIGENSTVVGALVSAIGGGIAAFKIITGVVKAYTAVQAALNFVMSANPIGLIIIAIAALATGLVYAYKHSETFRNIVNGAFSTVKLGALMLAKVAVQAFKFMANIYMTVVEALVQGAARAFGWVPGLGPKLKAAAGKVSEFKDSANAALGKIEKSLDVTLRTELAKKAADELAAYYHSRNWTVTATANVRMVYDGQGHVVPQPPPREHGGPVRAGQPYIVGERRPELFVPSSNGRIVPQVPTGSGGLSQADILRLAAAMGGVQLQTTVSAGSFDRQMGARL